MAAEKGARGEAGAVHAGAPAAVSFREAAGVWARIGLLSFGGPAGQVALMHKELVEKRKWIDEARFLHALNYCMLLPGPEAQQLATYIGWLMHRTRGGLVAGLLFVLPGFVSILVLSILYAGFRELPAIAAVFFGLKAAVLAVVVEAVIRIGKRALKNRLMVAIAALAFVAIFFFEVPFPLIVLGGGALRLRSAVACCRPRSRRLSAVKADGPHETVIDGLAASGDARAHSPLDSACAARFGYLRVVVGSAAHRTDGDFWSRARCSSRKACSSPRPPS